MYWIVSFAAKVWPMRSVDTIQPVQFGNCAWEGSLAEWMGEFQSDGTYVMIAATPISREEYDRVQSLTTE